MQTIHNSEFPTTSSCLHIAITLLDLFAHASSTSPALLLVCWWILCLYFKLIVLDLLPLFMLIWFSFKWKNAKQIEDDSDIYGSIMELEQRLDTMRYFSWKRGYARSSFIYLTCTYVVWISLQQIISLTHLFILLGSFIIIWKSEWTSPLKKTFKTMKYRFTRDNSQDRLWNRVHACQQQHDHQQSVFSFELYENQRFNLFSGQWEGTTLPFERRPWTDSIHHPISSKSQIVLPYFWNWIDDEWSADEWSYGTIIWTTGIGDKWYHNKTRRRMWTRNASTVGNGSTRRRSSIFYSQQSTVYDFSSADDELLLDNKKAPIDNNDHNEVTIKREEQEKKVANSDGNEIPNTDVSPLFATVKPQHDLLYDAKDQSPVVNPIKSINSSKPINEPTSSTSTSLRQSLNFSQKSQPTNSITSTNTRNSIPISTKEAVDDRYSYHRRSKRVPLPTGSREAIWKSIVQK